MIKHCLILMSIFCLLTCSKPKPYEWNIPASLPLPNVPSNNPMTAEKVALGRALFYEPALSGNKAMSCSTCHQPSLAFSDAKVAPTGATGQTLRRNSLALVNVAYSSNLTWAHNGLNHIEQQLMIPLFSEAPIEMGAHDLADILQRFNTQDYRVLFKRAFGSEEINVNRVVKALASFVRSLVSFNSRFDSYAYAGNNEALNEKELKGLDLFFSEKFECFHCHGGVNFTQASQHQFQQLKLQAFHNTGLYNLDGKGAYPKQDQGLIEATLVVTDMGKFRAPTLRNVSLTAPYMHDGSIASLEDVIRFYANGGSVNGKTNPYKSPFVKGFSITEDEMSSLIAFLNTLSDQSFVSNVQHHAPINPPKVKP